MRRPPRATGRCSVARSRPSLGVAGVAVGLAATAAYVAGRELEPDAAQTMAFATLALAELVLVFAVRAPRSPAWRAGRNPALILAVTGSVLVVAASIYLPLGRELLETTWLGPAELAMMLLLTLLPTAVLEVAKGLRR